MEYSPIRSPSKKGGKKELGFSGDFLNIDSPRTSESPQKDVLSRRMAGLTSTQKQFIQRVDFDRNL